MDAPGTVALASPLYRFSQTGTICRRYPDTGKHFSPDRARSRTPLAAAELLRTYV